MPDAIANFINRNEERVDSIFQDIRETAEQVAAGVKPDQDGDAPDPDYDSSTDEERDRKKADLRRDLILMVMAALLSDSERDEPVKLDRRYIPSWARDIHRRFDSSSPPAPFSKR